jgi:hypothetical protein
VQEERVVDVTGVEEARLVGRDRGRYTSQAMPARAPYAAIAVPALPLLSATIWLTPRARARATSSTAPRSLNEPVGIR